MSPNKKHTHLIISQPYLTVFNSTIYSLVIDAFERPLTFYQLERTADAIPIAEKQRYVEIVFLQYGQVKQVAHHKYIDKDSGESCIIILNHHDYILSLRSFINNEFQLPNNTAEGLEWAAGAYWRDISNAKQALFLGRPAPVCQITANDLELLPTEELHKIYEIIK